MEKTYISNNLVCKLRYDDKFTRYKEMCIDIRGVPKKYHELIIDDIRHGFVNYKDTIFWKYVDGIIYVHFEYHDNKYNICKQASVQVHLEDIEENKNHMFIFIERKHSNGETYLEKTCILVDDNLKAHPLRFEKEEREKIYAAEESRKPDVFHYMCIPRDTSWYSFVYDDAYFAEMYAISYQNQS